MVLLIGTHLRWGYSVVIGRGEARKVSDGGKRPDTTRGRVTGGVRVLDDRHGQLSGLFRLINYLHYS